MTICSNITKEDDYYDYLWSLHDSKFEKCPLKHSNVPTLVLSGMYLVMCLFIILCLMAFMITITYGSIIRQNSTTNVSSISSVGYNFNNQMHTVIDDENENTTENTSTETTRTQGEGGGEFYCPQGNKFNSSSTKFDKEFERAFEENCQCDCCRYGEMFPDHDFGCTAPFGLGKDLEENYNGKAACVIHDHCYGTVGTTQEACDNDLRENLRTVCKHGSYPDDCEDTIKFYLEGLQWLDKSGQSSLIFASFNDCPAGCTCRNRILADTTI